MLQAVSPSYDVPVAGVAAVCHAPAMRYVVYGAGAVGGTIGGRLHAAGRDVVLIARGEHLAALQADGLLLQSPDGEQRLAVAAVASPAEARIAYDDVVILCTKTQDTEAALIELAACASRSLAVVCAQNGVENERLALRRFPHVYAMLVFLPSQHLSPGVVAAASAPIAGVLDISSHPAAAPDARAASIAADLVAAGFASRATERIMDWKHRKLLSNVGNAIDALAGPDARGGDLHGEARAEALACYAAAGIVLPSEAEEMERRAAMSAPRPIPGNARDGSSSWQSLARGAGSIEADWLNGEIVLLGRLHGVPTPVNAALQRIANRFARERLAPGSLPLDALTDEVEASIEG